MATMTMTPRKVYYLSAHTVYQFDFSNAGYTEWVNGNWIWDVNSYIGINTNESVMAPENYNAVCIEYDISEGEKILSSVFIQGHIQWYQGKFFATLSTEAPGTDYDGSPNYWRFRNSWSLNGNKILASIESAMAYNTTNLYTLNFNDINKTINSNKIYLYLTAPNFNNDYITVTCYGITTNNAFVDGGSITYTLPSYTISYNANGGNSTPTSQTVNPGDSATVASAISRDNSTVTATYSLIRSATGWTISGGSDGSLVQTTTTSYAFNGWHIDSPSGSLVAASSSYTPTSDVVLYAGWDESAIEVAADLTPPTAVSITKSDGEANITVFYNSNGGFSFYRYQSISGQATYTWDGKWYTAEEGGNEVSSNLVLTSDIIVYPHFDMALNNTSFTFPTGEQCSRVGYKLLGWSSNPTATMPEYSPGESVNELIDTEFYAVWTYLDTSYIFINNGQSFEKYQPYIYDGSKFCLYDTYVYDGTKWVKCGEEPYADLITSDNKNFVTSDGKIFQVYSPESIEN